MLLGKFRGINSENLYSVNGRTNWSEGAIKFQQDVKHLLETPLGSMLGNINYGSKLYQLLFLPVSESTGTLIQEEIQRVIELNYVDIKVPYDFPNDLVEEFEGRWFNIVEEHDKYILKTNLLRLKEKGLIEYYESYMLRKIYRYGKGKVYEKAQMATEEQRAAIEQTKLEFMKSVNANSIQELYKLGPTVIKKYYHVIGNKIHELGFDEYSKAFIIFRASELKRLIGFFAPKFNNAQVNRLLKSKRFGIIPKSIHEQMVEKAIKYEPDVFATEKELEQIKKEG